MKCQDFREIIDSYLCDELLTETNHNILRHLEECADCRSVIETRRLLRSKIKGAVLNSPEFQVREVFCTNLRVLLKNASLIEERAENVFWTKNITRMAFAAGVIFAAGLGFWFFQTQSPQIFPSETVRTEEKIIKPSLAEFASGDHQNCAVKFNLAENPVEIDIKEAQYANLRQGIIEPLQSSDKKYEFLESHICKYAGHQFTHIVFKHQDKTVSILLMDLQNHSSLNSEEFAENFSNGYQVARFDAKNKAVFVVSNLSKQENTATARILGNLPNRELISNKRVEISYSANN